MAKIDAQGNLRGKYLNATFRMLNGKRIMQGKATPQRQTQKTKLASSDFGTVQRCNKQLRILLQYAMNHNHGKKMHTRLNKQVLKLIHQNETIPLGQRTYFNTDLSGIIGFDFNIQSPFLNYCTLPIRCTKVDDKKTIISIDSFAVQDHFNFKQSTCEIKVELFILHHPLNMLGIQQNETITFTVKENEIHPATEWIIQNNIHNSVTLVMGQLWYINQTITGQFAMVNSSNFHPSCILYIDNNM